MAQPLVICCGHIVSDHTFWIDEIPQPPSKERARDYAVGAGGMAANAAIAVARLGGRAVYWGRVGNDLNAEPLLEALAQHGVDVGDVRRCRGARTPVSAVLVTPDGERVTLGFRGEGLDKDPSWLPLERLEEADSVMCDPRWTEGAVRLLEAARAAGVPSVIDAEKSEQAALEAIVPLAQHVIFSATGLTSWKPGTGEEEGLRAAVKGGARLAAVTRGERGTAWVSSEGGALHDTPSFKVRATNTTGAGDVFHGAYALALAEGMELEAAIRFASAAGALRARDGVTPDREMVEAMLAGREVPAPA